jgi:hypothetical protein
LGYNRTSKAYKVYVPSQQKIVVSQDAKFDKDVGSSKSQEPPTNIKEVEKLAAPNTDPQILGKSELDQLGSSTSTETSLPPNTTRRLRGLT